MFSMVGRFRSLSDAEQQSLMQRIEQDAVPIVRESPGFRDVRLVVRPEENELMTVWLWDSAWKITHRGDGGQGGPPAPSACRLPH
jgi:heme-degrading monooxygenase HmoA